jgi:hypothetical protein
VSVATLSISAADKDIPLGSSETMDLSSICKMDDNGVMENTATPQTDRMETVKTVAFAVDGEASNGATTCTATLAFTFIMSLSDRLETLYEKMEECAKRKLAATDDLRQKAVAAGQRSGGQQQQGRQQRGTSSAMTKPTNRPAVSSGFLNKKKERRLQA